MHFPIVTVIALFAFLSLIARAEPGVAAAGQTIAKPHDFAKWEKDIAAFEKSDAVNPPPKHAVLFIGSSGIVRWKTLAADYPGTTILNRAFGGNQIADSTHFANRMIFPYEPRMIFIRAGGNDIHAGRPPEEVFNDYKVFVSTVRAKLPEIPIAYIGLSPSPSRWNEKPAGDKLNALISAYVKEQKNLIFIDDTRISLDSDGKIRPELFVEDLLHFNEAGYKLMAEAVRPFVPKD